MIPWRVLYLISIVAMLFFMIPIRVEIPNESTKNLFNQYVIKMNKTYQRDPEEYNRRYEIFKQTLSRIEEYNTNRDHNKSALYGLTPFSDLTEGEFYERHLGKTRDRNEKQYLLKSFNGDFSNNRVRREIIDKKLPLKVDWRQKGIISDVISQGPCGSCWAISAVQTIEAMYMKNHNKTSLSIQQIIDCARNGNYGCLGGDICYLLEWLVKSKTGIITEKEYPLTGKTNVCHLKSNKNSTGVHIEDFSCQTLINQENELLNWLAYNGPAAVAVNALSWQNYLGGVIQYHCDDSPLNLNHAIQVVGYDLTAEIPYYICKNSWGTLFGNKGYVYLAIGKNICGMVNEVSVMTVV